MAEEDITVPYTNLTLEEKLQLARICKRKDQLILEIEQLREEILQVTSEIEAYENNELEKENPQVRYAHIGKKKFNIDPSKGINYLIEHEIIENTTESIAKFLYKGEGLSKTAIGNYFGEKDDFNIEVLKTFIQLTDFEGMPLMDAFRHYLSGFRLPGEAQKIDRIVEKFSERYHEQNPDFCKHPDNCYILCYSIIMMNTCLHNINVRDKPSVEQFISMNRNIGEGGNFPDELLRVIYESIKSEPLKLIDDSDSDLMLTFFNPVKQGWLWKQGGRVKSWKWRWFILNDNCLYYFETTEDKEPKGIIPLENVQVREVPSTHRQHCFEIHSKGNDVIKACKTNSEGKVVEGKHNVYKMSAQTSDDREEWIRAIRTSVSDNPFYAMLASRRKKASEG